jgi:hypothetical protein
MSIIKTERSHVYAYEPLPRDSWVETLIGGKRMAMQPIAQYQAAVDWAVSMADQFDPPIHIVPIDANDLAVLQGERLERGLAAMSPDERHELRREIVTTAALAMRDCPDPDVRADAYAVLGKMGVV